MSGIPWGRWQVCFSEHVFVEEAAWRYQLYSMASFSRTSTAWVPWFHEAMRSKESRTVLTNRRGESKYDICILLYKIILMNVIIGDLN